LPDVLDDLRARIRDAFAATPAPDPARLRGSDEGDEPYLLEVEFADVPDWRTLGAAFIDRAPAGFGSALSFFSDEAFRYYLPAFLLADLDGVLQQADPLFHLWHGLTDGQGSTPVNDLRFGGWAWFDAVAARFERFTKGEADAIVAYMRYKADHDELGLDRPMIQQALQNYWLSRRPGA
jgi:hypothetical protein